MTAGDSTLGDGPELRAEPRIDFERMRRRRFDRVLAEMERHDLDVLILGRESNARYASDARRLWLAGTRPFGPGCVIVRATRAIHLMSVSDDGIPAAIPRDRLYRTTWNPLALMKSIERVPGLRDARRVGTDAMTPLMQELLPTVVPRAEVVDGEQAMRAARAVKSEDEIACIRQAIRVSERALDAVRARLEPGIRERQLAGAFQRVICEQGATIPATDGIFCMTPREPDPSVSARDRAGSPPFRRLATDRELASGDLVALGLGTFHAGYEGGLARTWPCGLPDDAPSGSRALHARWRAVLARLLEQCRPGRSAADLRRAHDTSGEPLPPVPIAHGIGIGVEPPIVGTGLGVDFEEEWPLVPGMVLALQVYVWTENVGGYFGKDIVRITDDAPEVLTQYPYGPLAT